MSCVSCCMPARGICFCLREPPRLDERWYAVSGRRCLCFCRTCIRSKEKSVGNACKSTRCCFRSAAVLNLASQLSTRHRNTCNHTAVRFEFQTSAWSASEYRLQVGSQQAHGQASENRLHMRAAVSTIYVYCVTAVNRAVLRDTVRAIVRGLCIVRSCLELASCLRRKEGVVDLGQMDVQQARRRLRRAAHRATVVLAIVCPR